MFFSLFYSVGLIKKYFTKSGNSKELSLHLCNILKYAKNKLIRSFT